MKLKIQVLLLIGIAILLPGCRFQSEGFTLVSWSGNTRDPGGLKLRIPNKYITSDLNGSYMGVKIPGSRIINTGIIINRETFEYQPLPPEWYTSKPGWSNIDIDLEGDIAGYG
jgi:hypothetical protein